MTSIEKINKRARSKYLQEPLLLSLVQLGTRYQGKYQDTLNCSELIYQKGGKLTSRYCGHRWCRICNRIRTGKLINGYAPALDTMVNKQFVTLTVPNVPADKLRQTIKQMLANVRQIQENRRRIDKLHGIRAIRKLECTYNPTLNNYHPHLHFIVEGKKDAEYLRDKWLKINNLANIKGQDIRPADTPLELFKYFAKLTSKTRKEFNNGKIVMPVEEHYPEALDTIFQAIERLRIIQPMGSIKYQSDDVEELQAEEYDETITDSPENEFYLWSGENWYSPFTGELLSSFAANHNLRIFRGKIRYLEKTPVE